MAYKYLRVEADEPMNTVFDPVEIAFMSRGAPAEIALFTARARDGVRAYLMPESALRVAPELAAIGSWVDIDAPGELQWGLLIGLSDAWDHHGIPRPTSAT